MKYWANGRAGYGLTRKVREMWKTITEGEKNNTHTALILELRGQRATSSRIETGQLQERKTDNIYEIVLIQLVLLWAETLVAEYNLQVTEVKMFAVHLLSFYFSKLQEDQIKKVRHFWDVKCCIWSEACLLWLCIHTVSSLVTIEIQNLVIL